MKRSEINSAIARAETAFNAQGFKLPSWAGWTPEQWAAAGREADGIRAARLGWDVTDFGLGRFAETGLTLFTLRNGDPNHPGTGKPYAEKIMFSMEGQVTPLHFHWKKMEDIILRGGGRLAVRLFSADAEGEPDTAAPVTVAVDGLARRVAAGGVVHLEPGESITLPPRLYHAFWAEGGSCVIGEVSMVNDDDVDNRFHEPVGRFPAIGEDAPALRRLCWEQPIR